MLDLQKIYAIISLNYSKIFLFSDLCLLSIVVMMLYFLSNKTNKHIYQNYNVCHKIVIVIIKIFFMTTTIGYISNNVPDNIHIWTYLFLFRILLLDFLNMFVMFFFGKKITQKRYLYTLCFVGMTGLMFFKFKLVNLIIFNCIFFCDTLKFANFVINFSNHIDFINCIHMYFQTPILLGIFSYFLTRKITEIISSNILFYDAFELLVTEMAHSLLIVILSIIDFHHRLFRNTSKN